MSRRRAGTGSNSFSTARKNNGINQKIVLTVRPPKKATPRKLRVNVFTRLFADCKELYFNLIRDTVSTWQSA